MTYRDLYSRLSDLLGELYDPREGATIARYLTEDIFEHQFWSEEVVNEIHLSILADIEIRLSKYEPWQYIGGFADFYGYKFKVDKSVLIPRPETEELVAISIDTLKEHQFKSILDIGTGSGIIPIVIAKKMKNIKAFAVDMSEDALLVAIKNATEHEVNVEFISSNFLDESLWGQLPQVEVVISNPPYIHTSEKNEMHSNVIDFEPHQALFVSHNVMEFYDALAKFVVSHQAKGTFLIVEINEKYGNEVCNIFASHLLTNIELIKDMQGKDRVVVSQFI
jgi:release factor glutamine methyltransferase